jgi:hypothetical protein
MPYPIQTPILLSTLQRARRLPRAVSSAAVVSAALLLVACASPAPAPVEALTHARAALTQAEAAGANQLAPVELLSAREKLNKADTAVREQRFADARRLADEATVDAQLAERTARVQRARQATTEMQRSNATLEAEINRSSKR